jgi:NTP pyrophosphatase (non-canonical NTP hydrolase)
MKSVQGNVRPWKHGGSHGGGRRLQPYSAAVEIGEFQARMEELYGARDRGRGVDATVAWLAEELGELARSVRKGSAEERLHELGDVLAWLASLANQLDLSLEEAAARYGAGCPKCGRTPCSCG